MSKVITFGNFKGGVGKTTASGMVSFLLHEMNKKVLLVDFDPQANLTGLMTNSFDYQLDENFISLFEACKLETLEKAIIPLNKNIHLLPSAVDLVGFRELVREKLDIRTSTLSLKQKEMEHNFLDYLLSKVKNQYDYVIIDVPPTISEFTNNALVASDYTLIIMQTEPDSLKGAIDYNNYAVEMKKFNPGLSVLGILPYLEKKRSKIDEYILKTSMSNELNIYDLIFKNHIYASERIKRFRINGVKNQDHHDKRVFKMYRDVTNEIIEKMERI